MINSILMEALSPIADTAPDYYDGMASRYIVFSYDTRPQDFADNYPQSTLYFITVDLFGERKDNLITVREDVIDALVSLGGTYPSETNASDNTGQHFVYEIELDGIPL